MTQTEVDRRLATSGLHPDDLHEIGRIFDCLTDTRKLEVLDSWNTIIARIKTRRAQLEEERLILITDPLNSLVEKYESYLRDFYHETATKNLKKLQTNI